VSAAGAPSPTRASRFRWPFETAGKAVPATAVEAAWREYRATGSEAGRDTLFERYIHLVRYMVSRLARTLPACVETEDLVSAGALGFLRALDSYDPRFGTDFSVYALTRIRGTMVDFVREIDPIGRITRRRLREAARIQSDLEQVLGRQPSLAETAARLGMSVDAYHALLAQASAATAVSLERLEGEADGGAAIRARAPDGRGVDPLLRLEEGERAAAVASVVATLSAAQQLVLRLHYVDDLNFREIAMLLDVSESRTTQLHAAAVATLRTWAGAGAAPARPRIPARATRRTA
jgi:RNA polymerase sigma factor for flagellar operon FliA